MVGRGIVEFPSRVYGGVHRWTWHDRCVVGGWLVRLLSFWVVMKLMIWRMIMVVVVAFWTRVVFEKRGISFVLPSFLAHLRVFVLF